MKYIAALALLGLITTTEAKVPNALAQIESRNFLAESDDDSSSSDEEDSLV